MCIPAFVCLAHSQREQNTFLHQEEIYFNVCVGLSAVSDSTTPRTVARQAPLSMGFSRQEYWSGLPFPSPEDLPNPGMEPWSPALQADSLQQGVKITLWRRKTRASGRPAPQEGNPTQLHRHQRLGPMGQRFPPRKVEEVSHKRHVASGSSIDCSDYLYSLSDS